MDQNNSCDCCLNQDQPLDCLRDPMGPKGDQGSAGSQGIKGDSENYSILNTKRGSPSCHI